MTVLVGDLRLAPAIFVEFGNQQRRMARDGVDARFRIDLLMMKKLKFVLQAFGPFRSLMSCIGILSFGIICMVVNLGLHPKVCGSARFPELEHYGFNIPARSPTNTR